jgi:hypothetical protein
MQLVKLFCAICFLPWLSCNGIGFKYLMKEFNYIQSLLDDSVSRIFIIYESTTVGDLEQSQVQEFVSKAGQENLLAKIFILGKK